MNIPLNALSKIIAVDAGNNEVKVCYGSRLDKFCSAITICDTEIRGQLEQHGKDDMQWEYEGKKGFGGTVAKIESDFGSGMYGATKNHFEGTMRIIEALHRNIDTKEIYLAVLNPYDSLTKEEATNIKKSLIKKHEVKINGVTKVFEVIDAIVVSEGAAAFHSIPYTSELVRIIDIGSGTINLISIYKGRIIDIESWTADYGMMTSKYGEASPQAISRAIIGDTSKKWKRDDKILVVGGPADKITPFIQSYYKRAEVLHPEVWTTEGIKYAPPVFGNVVGAYNVAVNRFKDVR